MKLSFKFLLAIIVITIIVVVVTAVCFVKKADSQTQFAQTKALQTADYGFQIITENAMSSETGAFVIDSLKNISGKTDDGGEFSVSIVKDTISIDSIELKIESRGTFGNESRLQSKRILLISPDSVTWVIVD